jgi:hypothetical protein
MTYPIDTDEDDLPSSSDFRLPSDVDSARGLPSNRRYQERPLPSQRGPGTLPSDLPDPSPPQRRGF